MVQGLRPHAAGEHHVYRRPVLARGENAQGKAQARVLKEDGHGVPHKDLPDLLRYCGHRSGEKGSHGRTARFRADPNSDRMGA